MRINQFIALATGLSRRKADEVIAAGRVEINAQTATLGTVVQGADIVKLDGKALRAEQTQTIVLNKPVGYVCSRSGQGSKTVYDLLPREYHNLKPVGRLDKDSSGLLLMTNDGNLANELLHPSKQKSKEYLVNLDKGLSAQAVDALTNSGVMLEDGLSKFDELDPISAGLYDWQVIIHEGRNRQIRRTFAALGYKVTALHRITFGDYELGNLMLGEYKSVQ